MSMTQTTTEHDPSDNPGCPNCNAPLPAHATFCGSCGARLDKQDISQLQDDEDIRKRYRITSLVRRRPYVNLVFAVENQLQRPVAIRDIDITNLDQEKRVQAAEHFQHEYDLLRQERIPHLMPVLNIHHFRGHLFVVTGLPLPTPENTKKAVKQLRTLHDALQRGVGLPDEQTALRWIDDLCSTLDYLHSHQIVIGDLDPDAIILEGEGYESDADLMVSWLPSVIRNLLPRMAIANNTIHYSAPEAVQREAEPRSDLYSLGAVLYLLLTGTPPAYPTLRMQGRLRLRSPRELNPRISVSTDEFVRRTLALDPSDRFQSAGEMSEALYSLRFPSRSTGSSSSSKSSTLPKETGHEPGEATVRLIPLPQKSLDIWRAAKALTNLASSTQAEEKETPSPVPSRPLPRLARVLDQRPPITPIEDDPGFDSDPELPAIQEMDQSENAGMPSLQKHWRQITGPLPTIPKLRQQITGVMPALQRTGKQITGMIPAIPRLSRPATPVKKATQLTDKTEEPSFLKLFQHTLLGEQRHVTTAAAIIETPLRIQPTQAFSIRIHLMGRDKPQPVRNKKQGYQTGGLSSLAANETVRIEVRSALYQNFAYIIQQTAVDIPAEGFAADVTIPMQPLSHGPSGRRERLHIFFLDEQGNQLYEKPFVLEIFVSHLVHAGREGHNVLTIPL